MRLSPFRSRTETEQLGSHKVFVIGSGRSGTHWVGYILEAHPDIHVTIETKPVFDWVYLGLGDDGHTASLFPGSPALAEKDRWVVSSRSPAGVADRITMTFPILNQAKTVCIVAAGEKKAAPLGKISHEGPASGLPAALIEPASGDLRLFVDLAAAARGRTRARGNRVLLGGRGRAPRRERRAPLAAAHRRGRARGVGRETCSRAQKSVRERARCLRLVRR